LKNPTGALALLHALSGFSATAVWGFLAGVLLGDLGVVGLPALAPTALAVYLAVAGAGRAG
jgi:hypothetical protein